MKYLILYGQRPYHVQNTGSRPITEVKRWHFIRGVKLTTHLRLVPRSKNGWSCTSLLPHTPSWRGAQLGRAQAQLYLYSHILLDTKII